MKTFKIPAAIICICLFLPAFSQNGALMIKPACPKQGGSIELTYSPQISPTGLNGEDSIISHFLVIEREVVDIREKVMTGKKGSWKVKLQVPENANLMLIRFSSGNKNDDNNGDCWEIPVCGKDNKPVKDAYYFLASLHQRGEIQGFRLSRSKEKVMECIEKELAVYPGNMSAVSLRWSQLMNQYKNSDSIRNQIKKEVLALYQSHKSEEKTVYSLMNWFERTGMQKEVKAFRDSILNANPRGYFALQNRLRSVLANPEPSADEVEKVLAEFPDMETATRSMLMNILISACVKSKNFQKADELISKADIREGMMFNSLAWPLIEKGENLEKATEWAARGVELLRKQKAGQKDASPNQMKNIGNSLGMVLDTYGYGLEQLGKTGEALKAYAEAFELSEGMQEDVNGRYVQLLAKSADYNKVIQVAEACILKEKANDNVTEAYKQAYKQLTGSPAEAEARLNKLAAEAKAGMMEEHKKEMLNQPAPDFNLKDFDGNYVKLSDLKGKVVVVDFWATWCGPCKMSFPALQKIYEKYKSNPEIQILALDTWEREKSAVEKEKKVKNFIAENKYSFKVLFDEGDIVVKYGVTGIPTKFIIDKNGRLQFRTIGFDGEKKMVAELEAAFELLTK